MKTLKALKITSVIQAIFCTYCLLSTLLIVIGTSVGPIFLANTMLFLFYATVEFSILIVPICFIINLITFIKERKYPEQRNILGKKWIWIFVWPIIATVFFLIQILPFIRVPIFS